MPDVRHLSETRTVDRETLAAALHEVAMGCDYVDGPTMDKECDASTEQHRADAAAILAALSSGSTPQPTDGLDRLERFSHRAEVNGKVDAAQLRKAIDTLRSESGSTPQPEPLDVAALARAQATVDGEHEVRDVDVEYARQVAAEYRRAAPLHLRRVSGGSPMTPSRDDMHDCPANGCPRRIPFEQMACRAHWFALPPTLRGQVSRAWRSGTISDVLAVRRDVETFLNGTVR